MIVAEEVKQAVQGEDLELGRVRVVSLRGLTPGNAGGDDETSSKSVVAASKPLQSVFDFVIACMGSSSESWEP